MSGLDVDDGAAVAGTHGVLHSEWIGQSAVA